jgi:hypothetical protein
LFSLGGWQLQVALKTPSVLALLESKVITKRLYREWLRAKADTKWRQGCQVLGPK